VKQKNTVLSSTPAFEHRDVLRSQVIYRKLPELSKRLKTVEQKIKNIEK